MMGRNAKISLIISLAFMLTSLTALTWVILKVDQEGDNIHAQVKVIADSLAQEKEYRDLENLVVSSAVKREQIAQFVLTEDKTIDFLSQVETIGEEQGVNLQTTSLEVKPGEGMFDSLLVSFSLKGEEDRLYKMIKILEELPYHGELRELDFTRKGRDGNSTVRVQLAVSIVKI